MDIEHDFEEELRWIEEGKSQERSRLRQMVNRAVSVVLVIGVLTMIFGSRLPEDVVCGTSELVFGVGGGIGLSMIVLVVLGWRV